MLTTTINVVQSVVGVASIKASLVVISSSGILMKFFAKFLRLIVDSDLFLISQIILNPAFCNELT